MFRALLATFLSLLISGCALQPPTPTPLQAWTQLGPEGRVSIRAIVPAAQACPTATAEGREIAMAPRATASPAAPNEGNPAFQPAFSVQSCEGMLSATPSHVEVGGRPLPAPLPAYRRIIVVGDTGCRIKMPADGKGDPIQDCGNPDAWPWAKIAKAAADKAPELVIHVGDYHYREYCDDPTQCAPVKAAGTIVDYGWRGWQADFFTPAAPLLAAAPWIFVRGNHENCDRGGEGWQRFLAPGPYRSCPNQLYRSASRSVAGNNLTETGYRVDLDGDTSLFVADSAGSEDYRLAADTRPDTEVLTAALAGLARIPSGRQVWLLSHKPLWYDLLAPGLQPNAWQAAARRTLIEQVNLTVAGHEHAFQTLNFAPAADPGYAGGRPGQLIVGGGGTQLDGIDPASPHGKLYEGLPATDGIVLNRFSFLLLEKENNAWRGTVFDPDGLPITRCRLPAGAKRFACEQPEQAR